MGVMNFLVPNRELMPSFALDRAYFANREEIPEQCRLTATLQGFSLQRSESDSGTFTIPWQTDAYGVLALTTSTLMERDKPYSLPVELARGTLSRLRNQAALWSAAGMTIDEAFRPALNRAVESFALAATQQSDGPQSSAQAQQSIEASLSAGQLLAVAYSEQASLARSRLTPRMAILLGIRLDDRVPELLAADHLLEAANTLAIPFASNSIETSPGERNWELPDRQVAWCQAQGIRICGGPLLDLNDDRLSEWNPSEIDAERRMELATEHLHAVVSRYRGRVHLWHCAAGINTGTGLKLNEEQRLRLAVKAIEVVRAADARSPVIISFNQPWGEYLRDQAFELSPIHFADALSRGDLGLSGIGLEINIGTDANQTLPRDLLEFSRQLDRWSSLNLPLLIMLTVPSEFVAMETETSNSRPGASGESTHQSAAAWIERFVPVILGKQSVQAIVWSQYQDVAINGAGTTGHFAVGRGVFDELGAAKPVLQALAKIRR